MSVDKMNSFLGGRLAVATSGGAALSQDLSSNKMKNEKLQR
jgi:long-subunit acyl-CoA synthetase (AMP-forming)